MNEETSRVRQETPEQSGRHEAAGYTIHGDVQTGAIGTRASANVGSIGEGSRGHVTVVRDPAEERHIAQMFLLVEELRDALEEYRESMDGELLETVETNIDDLEESLEEMKPAKRIQSKLKTLQMLLQPFDTLVGLVGRIIELVRKSEG